MNKNQHIPQGYKDSPLGIIPEDWEVKRLGEVCTHFKSGNTITSKSIYEEGLYAVYGGNGLRGYTNTFTHDGNYILIGRQGALCGNINYIEGKNYITEHAIAVQTNENTQWLKYKLEHWNLNRFAESSAQPGLSVEKLVRYKLSIPTHQEQAKIAEILSLWDTAISKQTALLDKLTLRKRGLMQQLLTGKKRLKGFEGEWSYHTIQDHFTEIRDKNDGEGHIPMTISAKLGLISQTHKFDRVVAGNSLDKYTLLRKGDFAYNKGNSNLYEMGCIYRLKEESAVVPFVYICFRVIDKTCCEFYQQFFINHGLDKQLKQIITSGARGDGLLNVNSEDFMALKIPYPSIEEQNAIASILVQADQEIEIQKQKLSRLQEQKKGLMQVLLTGKKRIK
ncbi:MAG: restriction endonuclease subunit S [Bacteroidales bacterium]|nr:restriction endonuclease subunit S [Bacteroidales bacterium]